MTNFNDVKNRNVIQQLERITDINEIEKMVFIGSTPNKRLPALRKGNWRIGYNCIHE